MKTWRPKLAPFRKHKKEVYASMSIVSDFIYQIGEYPPLREPSKPVDISKLSTPEYKAKIRYMKTCLKKYRKLTGKGRALAAVQLGIPEEIIVVYMPELEGEMMTIINPVITKNQKNY